MLMHAQVNTSEEKYKKLWVNIIKQKISNQSRALPILGVEGAETIATYISQINIDNVDYIEALAAKDYFSYYHSSQLNAFNLANDLIEPFRAIVDVVAHNNISSNVILNKAERKELTHTLHNACIVNGIKTNVLSAIDMTCESLKRIILDKSNE